MAVPPAVPQWAWGFPLHAACWVLLKEIHHPKDINIQALNNLCRSFPVSAGHLNWGHNFGGLLEYSVGTGDLFPGEECFLTGYIMPQMGSHDDVSHLADPLYIPALDKILQEGTEDTIPVAQGLYRGDKHIPKGSDPFKSLPVEIWHEILPYLLSGDILNLKLSSTVLAAMPLPNSFWASRFQRGFEFHYIFEARRFRGRKFNWKMVYLKVKDFQKTASFRNRRRIWKILLRLKVLLADVSGAHLQGRPSQSYFEPAAPKDDLTWIIASGAIQEPGSLFMRGCRALWMRTITVPCKVANIYVSFIAINEIEYISGVRFRQNNGLDVCLGYIFPKTEIPVQASCFTDGQDKCNISYLYLAVDSRGFRALSFPTGIGSKQNKLWFGHSEGTPKMRLPMKISDSMAFKAGFDGLKMVSLGISRNESIPIDGETSRQEHLGLRESAQWVPEVPDDRLCLNESSFENFTDGSQIYLPLTTAIYGGLGGVHLKKLIRITVWVFDYLNIYGIDFVYNVKVEGRLVHTLGRAGPFLDTARRGYEPYDSSTDLKVDFQIDGPGGEVIDKIDIQRNYYQLIGFRIHTNHNRHATFPPHLNCDHPFSSVQGTQSTPITGLYAKLENPAILANLGVISQKI
ncbi:hypothetical protein FQN49_000503 [Arthroderma sp. PD_2]|nr:hypothetical protein FQN49_000503 [Arthroderma sp. PD_2]